MNVLIAGGGVAGVEAALTLHHLAGDRVRVTVLSPPPDDHAPTAHALGHLSNLGVTRLPGALESVDPDARRVNGTIPYDALIVAVGAARAPAFPGARTLWMPGSEVPEGRVTLALPAAPHHALPAYDFALRLGRRVTVVTPERRPLEMFGDAAATAVTVRLDDAGVELHTGCEPVAAHPGALELADGRSLPADAVLAPPALHAPPLPGLPDGFLPLAVADGIYAAGDITDTPLKLASLAAQQANVAAEAIAATAGAPVTPQPYRPVLRGLLLSGGDPLYLRRDGSSRASTRALWWPPVRIPGRHLASFLVSAGSSTQSLVDREP